MKNTPIASIITMLVISILIIPGCELVRGIFNPHQKSVEEKIKALKEGKTLAISPKIGIGKVALKDSILLINASVHVLPEATKKEVRSKENIIRAIWLLLPGQLKKELSLDAQQFIETLLYKRELVIARENLIKAHIQILTLSQKEDISIQIALNLQEMSNKDIQNIKLLTILLESPGSSGKTGNNNNTNQQNE